MLTADHVRAYIQKGQLKVRELKGHQRDRATVIAESLIQVIQESQGLSRADIEERLDDIEISNQDNRVALGLRKLVTDRCEFVDVEGPDPSELRQSVFQLASKIRQQIDERDQFKDRVLAKASANAGIPVGEIEMHLYADLKSAQRLNGFTPISADRLIEAYDDAQFQAVLLKATHITIQVDALAVGPARSFFRALKFRRLLYRVTRSGTSGYTIDIDGPHSLFQSSTKYGLQLALVYPAIRQLGSFQLTASVRWGKDKESVTFEITRDGENTTGKALPPPDDVAHVLKRFRALDTAWKAKQASTLLNVPGAGLSVPDVVFSHPEFKAKAYLEVMGFWSRDAVWRRVELVEKGLKAPVIFAVSERLRVSEAALGDDVPSRLYVYKGVMNARRILEMLDALLPQT